MWTCSFAVSCNGILAWRFGSEHTLSFMPTPTKPAIHPVQSYWFLLPEPHNSEIKHSVVPDHSLVNTLCVTLCFPSSPSLSSTTLFISLFSLNFINIYTLTYCLCYTAQLSQCICFVSYISYSCIRWLTFGANFPASFGHLWPYRPMVKTKSMTKVFVYSIPFLFPANVLVSALSKLSPSSHLSLCLSFMFLFEKGSCLCLQSAF